jgi:hypothetical protein
MKLLHKLILGLVAVAGLTMATPAQAHDGRYCDYRHYHCHHHHHHHHCW